MLLLQRVKFVYSLVEPLAQSDRGFRAAVQQSDSEQHNRHSVSHSPIAHGFAAADLFQVALEDQLFPVCS